MLRREVLRPAAARLFDALAAADAAKGVTLVGGTALALQIGHRTSLDFDFATHAPRLPARQIDRIVEQLKTCGFRVDRITSPAKESQFRIQSGEALGDFVRDYVCDGVKLQFFTHGKTRAQQAWYAAAERVVSAGMSFDILGLDGLKTAKTLVLADRVRSRDLFDLMVLIRDHGFSVQQALERAASLGTNNDPEYYKAVMRGDIPVDALDEGLAPIGVATGMAAVYAYLGDAVDEYERQLAAGIFGAAHQGESST